MPNTLSKEVNLTKRVQTAKGMRYCPVVLAANGRVKPDLVIDNHARDAMKYVLMSLPEPSVMAAHDQLREQLKDLAREGDLTSAYIRFLQAKAEESGDQPQPHGAYLRYRILTGYRE